MPQRTVADLVSALGRIAPLSLAESWDNVGLILGDPTAALAGPALLTIDLSEAVADEAVRRKAGAVVAYHPPIFSPVKRLTASTPIGRSLLRLAGSGVAVYSPHTALDAAEGGVADWLLSLVCPNADGRRAIAPHGRRGGGGDEFKVTVFVPTEPPDVIDRVRGAMSAAGAGIIGAYSSCSFAVPGVGTFLAGEGANPSVGEVGGLEYVTELRLEMVCASRALAPALDAMRREHPYEEPAFDVIRLEPRPDWRVGAGRIAAPGESLTAQAAALRLKKALPGTASVQLAQAADKPITRVAAVPGSGGSLAPEAIALGCDLFITGEMKHHEVLACVNAGCSVLLGGHTETERGYLPQLAHRLTEAGQGIAAQVSQADVSPLQAV